MAAEQEMRALVEVEGATEVKKIQRVMRTSEVGCTCPQYYCLASEEHSEEYVISRE
jgi:hypothetical protein